MWEPETRKREGFASFPASARAVSCSSTSSVSSSLQPRRVERYAGGKRAGPVIRNCISSALSHSTIVRCARSDGQANERQRGHDSNTGQMPHRRAIIRGWGSEMQNEGFQFIFQTQRIDILLHINIHIRDSKRALFYIE